MENRSETDAGLVVSSRKRLKNRLAGMSLFWKACLLAAGLLMAVVILAEATLEPLGEALLFRLASVRASVCRPVCWKGP